VAAQQPAIAAAPENDAVLTMPTSKEHVVAGADLGAL
jgi:hypothetical protein